jgi:hypothetical protein
MTKTDEKTSNELGKKFEPSVFQHQKKKVLEKLVCICKLQSGLRLSSVPANPFQNRETTFTVGPSNESGMKTVYQQKGIVCLEKHFCCLS